VVPHTYDDLVDMRKLNDAELMRNLKGRFHAFAPFCYCGITLVSMNTFLWPHKNREEGEEFGPWDFLYAKDHPMADFLHNLYSPSTLMSYLNMVDRSTLPPHAWALASQCYHEVKKGIGNQSIVITGESGAGKTFVTRKMLAFLAAAGTNPDSAGSGEDDPGAALTDALVNSSDILEGWGNANMPRNPDSSRFGKLYKIYFKECRSKKTQTAYHGIVGCDIEPYMLEKSRVTAQQMCERNYHIFYRMIKGPKLGMKRYAEKAPEMEAELKKYDKTMYRLCPDKAAKEGDYLYLDGGQMASTQEYLRIYDDVPEGWQAMSEAEPFPEARNYGDDEAMSDTLAALHTFFTPQVVDMILRVTAGCLIMGNIDYENNVKDLANVLQDGKSGKALDDISDLWQVPRVALIRACHEVQLNSGKKIINSPQAVPQAQKMRDSIARSVYDELFTWMVAEISKTMQHDKRFNPNKQKFIGVLDIFGFEFYEEDKLQPVTGTTLNSLDQYNINYCNEKLQNHFVQVIFGQEKALYKDQLNRDDIITQEKFNQINNKDTLDLLGQDRKHCVVACLKEACKTRPDTEKFPGMENIDAQFFGKLEELTGKKGAVKASQKKNNRKEPRITTVEGAERGRWKGKSKRSRYPGNLGDSKWCKKEGFDDIMCAFYVQVSWP